MKQALGSSFTYFVQKYQNLPFLDNIHHRMRLSYFYTFQETIHSRLEEITNSKSLKIQNQENHQFHLPKSHIIQQEARKYSTMFYAIRLTRFISNRKNFFFIIMLIYVIYIHITIILNKNTTQSKLKNLTVNLPILVNYATSSKNATFRQLLIKHDNKRYTTI